jgi:3-oxoacid CoA-transferase subunit B
MKEGLTKEQMAKRAALELQDGFYVNLGIGLPTLVSNFIPPERTVIFESENGILGMGPIIPEEEGDPDLANAGDQPVTILPGASFFDSATSFVIIRGRHLDATILGGFQVSEKGDLANWKLPKRTVGSYGGAVDLAMGARKVIALMQHVTKNGEPRIVKKCSYLLTGKECVNLIITNLAVIEVTEKGLALKEIAPNWTVEEIQALTEPNLKVVEGLKVI